MPRFYFDLDDGNCCSIDANGEEMKNLREAQAEALRSLNHVASVIVAEGGRSIIACKIRDDQRRTIFTAHLALISIKLKPSHLRVIV